MPQFDFTTYASQIFWFGLCFITLYIFAQLVILPRIKSIISKRIELIDSDKSLASEINHKTNSINQEAESNLQKANAEYLKKIEEITKKAVAEREQSIEKLKQEIEVKVQNSRNEIKKFVEESKTRNMQLIENVAQIIKNKIIN